MAKKIETYRDLNIWNLGIDLVKDIYKSTERFPKQEIYGIVSQMRRSAISIPSNIAEGFKRYHNKESILLDKLDHIGRMITNLLKKLE